MKAANIAAAVALGALTVVPVAASAESLREALEAAYSGNPAVLAERANLRATDEEVPQALSGWRPNVAVTADVGRERRESTGTFGAGNQTLTPWGAQFFVDQPLYRGGRTTASTRSAEAQVTAGRANLESVNQDLFLDVITAYMNVLRDEAVVQLTDSNVNVLRRQLEATRDRFEVGEVTRTDVAQAEARLARAVSDRQQAEGNLISSRATYERVVGRMPSKLDPPPPLPVLPETEESSIEVAMIENPVVVSAVATEEASKHDIRATSGQLLPEVSLRGTIDHSENRVTNGSETDSFEITAQVTVPLYQSGAVYSRVRQARQINNRRRLEIEDVRRAVREQTTQAWEALQTARAQINSSSEEVRANEIALEGVIQEAQVGSRTTLDVLDAEQELLDARVALVRAERDEYVAAYSLQNAIGRLTIESLDLTIEPYDPTENYDRVRNKLWGTDGGLD